MFSRELSLTLRRKEQELINIYGGLLAKKYPRIPPVDKSELHRLISSLSPSATTKSILNHIEIRIYSYVRDQYMTFESLTRRDENHDAEAIDQVHERVREILASWRGED